ncbi:MAG: sigma-70 family RNA polymerase sigma factor [Bacteroidaceae bacterium]|nr:sigma-70 family RNA polymerase sigma factor [Bacteroidaceae bacterium]
MTDKEIIEKLIARDERVTSLFFFKNCRPLFLSIIRYVFSYEVDYEEFVNEFYLYLMEENACKLRQFEGRSSIYQWLKITAIRYFIAKRNRMIDMAPKDPPSDITTNGEMVDEESETVARMDIASLFERMSNKRYVYVIRRLVLDDAEPKDVARELQVSVENLYNIKKRAIASMTQIALNETEKYEKEISRR